MFTFSEINDGSVAYFNTLPVQNLLLPEISVFNPKKVHLHNQRI